ncbi:MAG: hypothetical protein MRT15_08210 [archaeon YNP-LCB-003-016]|uniref:pyruvate kinase alpha/beta domain-containing protein n=1 Tax=Candidatus Culexarchaeum yellowstonense TaxID=2928963 RepID=UPI0026E9D281|nr:pyruvate kinase alpha/beta domain-containing protein [Candidatus Culexarchaeum yellowstonense]MCR6692360.1 hypothetical protein [Candidatus Culexarchaeum yellowstonense]
MGVYLKPEFYAKQVFYFHYRGEINTEMVLSLARDRAIELGIRKVIIPSETGRSALKALKIFKGTNVNLIVVTHYPAKTIGPKGDIPIGLNRPEYVHVKRFLESHGVIVIQGTRPFAGIERSMGWDSPTPETFIDKTLEIFGSGTKIAVEAALMATDAGFVDEGEVVVSLGGTYKGLDTALIVKSSYSMHFFTHFEVLEIIAKPLHPGVRLPEHVQEGWRGDVDQYYKPIDLKDFEM